MISDHDLAWVDEKIYNEIYEESIRNPNDFWMHHAQDIFWKQTPRLAFNKGANAWLPGGISNVCYNCLDRHIPNSSNKPAIVWYGDDQSDRREITYLELLKMVRSIASRLKVHGIRKGDVVAIYMPMIPEAIATMLASARIGALHLVTFSGFSSDALAYRLSASKAKIIVTTSSFQRRGKTLDLLQNVKSAILNLDHPIEILNLDDIEKLDNELDHIEWQSSDDDLFVLYTSGSSGKPKGIIHSALPYILYVSTTFKTIFGIRPDDVYFCTSDIGWITGHSYITYAPLFHGLTLIIFSGNPTYPNADRYWEIIENERASIFYTAPTAIRSLQMFDNSFVKNHDLSSLRVLGSVGEPINRSAWEWFFNIVGNRHCPIMDTWWQTESGGIVLSPLRTLSQRPCVAGRPFFGVSIKIQEDELMITNNWPGLCKSIMYECEISGNSKQFCLDNFNKQYFRNDVFATGDRASYEDDQQIKISGRLDDVINISGHRLGTAEFECAINKLEEIKECAVVGVSDDIKGQCAFVYAVLNDPHGGTSYEQLIIQKIINSIKESIGSIAKPDFIFFVRELPKTRSGKILRHILRDIANTKDSLSSTESLINPDSIDYLKANIENCYFVSKLS